MVDNQPETTRPLAEVRTEIEDQLKWQKAQAEAEKQAKALEATMKTPADLDRIAKERSAAGHRDRPDPQPPTRSRASARSRSSPAACSA